MEVKGKAPKGGKRSRTSSGLMMATVERKEVERERRQHMKELCAKLASLIPKENYYSSELRDASQAKSEFMHDLIVLPPSTLTAERQNAKQLKEKLSAVEVHADEAQSALWRTRAEIEGLRSENKRFRSEPPCSASGGSGSASLGGNLNILSLVAELEKMKGAVSFAEASKANCQQTLIEVTRELEQSKEDLRRWQAGVTETLEKMWASPPTRSSALDLLAGMPDLLQTRMNERARAGAHKALFWSKTHYPGFEVSRVIRGIASGDSDEALD